MFFSAIQNLSCLRNPSVVMHNMWSIFLFLQALQIDPENVCSAAVMQRPLASSDSACCVRRASMLPACSGLFQGGRGEVETMGSGSSSLSVSSCAHVNEEMSAAVWPGFGSEHEATRVRGRRDGLSPSASCMAANMAKKLLLPHRCLSLCRWGGLFNSYSRHE